MISTIEANKVFEAVHVHPVTGTCFSCGKEISECNCDYRQNRVNAIMEKCSDAEETIMVAGLIRDAKHVLEIHQNRIKESLGYRIP